MDWQDQAGLEGVELSRYRRYQYNLIASHLGARILEIGSGDRSFTKLIEKHHARFERLLSIEPSKVLFDLHRNHHNFDPRITFLPEDLFDLTVPTHGTFDTIVMVHVLEHIEQDREALNQLWGLLEPGGRLLIIVPALQWLYSVHDQALGHFRRYDRQNLRAAIDSTKFLVERMWYQDPVGVLGSWFFFKAGKIRLKSASGVALVRNQGRFYDRWIIPFEERIERWIPPPFGLSLSTILSRR